MKLLNLIRHHEDVASYKRGRAEFLRDIDPDGASRHDKDAMWHEEMAEYLRGNMEAVE